MKSISTSSVEFTGNAVASYFRKHSKRSNGRLSQINAFCLTNAPLTPFSVYYRRPSLPPERPCIIDALRDSTSISLGISEKEKIHSIYLSIFFDLLEFAHCISFNVKAKVRILTSKVED